MASELDYSTTAASNTDINGVGITGANLPSNLDNAMREMAANAANAQPRATTKSANYTATKDDFGKAFVFDGAYTLTIPTISSVATGWYIYAEAAAASVLGIARSGSNTLNGAASLSLPAGRRCRIIASASATDIKVDFEKNQANDFYSGSSSSNTNFPISQTLFVVYNTSGGPGPTLNQSISIYRDTVVPTQRFVTSPGGTQLAGTWVCRGYDGTAFLAERTE